MRHVETLGFWRNSTKFTTKAADEDTESGSFGIGFTKDDFEPSWEAFISLSLLGKGCILIHELRPDSATHHICSLGKRTDLDAEE